MITETSTADLSMMPWYEGVPLLYHLEHVQFDDVARSENVRRAAEVARLLADAGAVVLVGLISPFAADRRLAQRLHAEDGLEFLEVHVDTSLRTCERRDPKGLYVKARHGEIAGFTGSARRTRHRPHPICASTAKARSPEPWTRCSRCSYAAAS